MDNIPTPQTPEVVPSPSEQPPTLWRIIREQLILLVCVIVGTLFLNSLNIFTPLTSLVLFFPFIQAFSLVGIGIVKFFKHKREEGLTFINAGLVFVILGPATCFATGLLTLGFFSGW